MFLRQRLHLAIAASCLIVSAPAFSQTATSSRTKTHVQTLASDKFEGRLTGSPGEKLAADYLIAELKRMGAKPLPGMTDFRMPFTFTAGSKDGGSTFAYKDETSAAGTVSGGSTSVLALSFSDSGSVSGDSRLRRLRAGRPQLAELRLRQLPGPRRQGQDRRRAALLP